MARKFLYIVAGLIVLALAASFAYRLYGPQMIRAAMVPSAAFVEQEPVPADRYADAGMWVARPDIPDNPALWIPAGVAQTETENAAIFFIHPTSYLDRSAWNAPLDDQLANERAALFVRGQASAFSAAGEIWAPRYRQATFGAFLTGQKEAGLALDAAYRDVATAYDHFIGGLDPDRPIILAGHSQGALHLVRLLREKVAGRPIAKRIVAAYVVGWPISEDTDLAALGLPACEQADQTGCILSWQSFAEPADPQLVLDTFDATTGFDGRPRKDTAMVCTNPLTGAKANGPVPASANLGTLVPDADLKDATFEVGMVPARCGDRGILLIGEPPEGIGTYVLPGNNYHVFDYSLFWGNVRADALRRVQAFDAARRPGARAARAISAVASRLRGG